ncbi:MAG: alpha/beta hydrolase [Halieaceae bacterium]
MPVQRSLLAKYTPLLGLLLLLHRPCFADAGIDYPPVAAEVDFETVLSLPVAKPDSLQSYGTAPGQFAELWLPASTAEPVPVVAFIHGGCWLNAYSIDHSHALATGLAQAGYAVWNIEYRRVGDAGGGWPGSFEDVQAALALLLQQRDPRLDLQRLLLAGHSAGGHLALLAAANADPRSDTAYRAVFGLAAIVDIVEYAGGTGSCNAATPRFMGGMPAQRPEHYRAANPEAKTIPGPVYLLRGSRDRIVPLRPVALPVHTQVDMEAGHFDWITPGSPAWNVFLEQLAAASR